jgi:hypothetical protein
VLDCETPLGRQFIEEQYRVQQKLQDRGYTVFNSAGKANHADVFLCKEEDGWPTLVGIAEIKCRKSAGGQPINRQYLIDNGGYLITYTKLKYGAMVSGIHMVPFFVIVSLIDEGVILVWQITNKSGDFVEEIVHRVSYTRKTVNGGDANRTNAFLQMDSKYLTVIE